MNSVEFNALSFQRRASLVLNKCKYFDEHVEYGKCIWKYYLLDDFVVEVEYTIEGNEIQTITAFQPVTFNPDKSFQEPSPTYFSTQILKSFSNLEI